MEAICSSEMSVNFQRTTRRYIPEDSTLRTDILIFISGTKSIYYSSSNKFRVDVTSAGKIKLSLYLIRRHAVKTCGGVQVWLHTFLI
jgi:hypothetical protein